MFYGTFFIYPTDIYNRDENTTAKFIQISHKIIFIAKNNLPYFKTG